MVIVPCLVVDVILAVVVCAIVSVVNFVVSIEVVVPIQAVVEFFFVEVSMSTGPVVVMEVVDDVCLVVVPDGSVAEDVELSEDVVSVSPAVEVVVSADVGDVVSSKSKEVLQR